MNTTYRLLTPVDLQGPESEDANAAVRAACRLRGEVFSSEGYLSPDELKAGLDLDGFDDMATHILVMDDSRVIGTVRMFEQWTIKPSLCGRTVLPMETVFRNLGLSEHADGLARFIDAKKRNGFAEVSRLCLEAEARIDHTGCGGILADIYTIIYWHSAAQNINDLLIVANLRNQQSEVFRKIGFCPVPTLSGGCLSAFYYQKFHEQAEPLWLDLTNGLLPIWRRIFERRRFVYDQCVRPGSRNGEG